MKTTIPGIKASEMIISKDCRKIHGQPTALEIAITEIIKKYGEALSFEANKNATIRIVMTIDRDI